MEDLEILVSKTLLEYCKILQQQSSSSSSKNVETLLKFDEQEEPGEESQLSENGFFLVFWSKNSVFYRIFGTHKWKYFSVCINLRFFLKGLRLILFWILPKDKKYLFFLNETLQEVSATKITKILPQTISEEQKSDGKLANEDGKASLVCSKHEKNFGL